MREPLVDLAELPEWMRPVAQGCLSVPRERISRFQPPDDRELRSGSVLMLFSEGEQGPEVLLIERAATLRDHAGQPAFPGGGIDPGEDAIAAAVREGWEETGLDPKGVVPVALLPELWLPVSDFRVVPVLAWWRERSAVYVKDHDEVASVLSVPVAELADPANRFQLRYPNGWVAPAFTAQHLVVWGFTAGLLSVLLDLGGWSLPYDLTDIRELPPMTGRVPSG